MPCVRTGRIRGVGFIERNGGRRDRIGGAAERTRGRPTGSILLVAQSYSYPAPPVTRRPRALAKYLEREGYEVTVLTSAAGSPDLPEPSGGVVRCPDLVAVPLGWRRITSAILRRDGHPDYQGNPSLLSGVVVPDLATLTWLPFALPLALRIAGARRIDCVLTTSPPESMHLVGLALHHRGVPWVADLRDGWGLHSYRKWPTRYQRRLDAWIERTTLTRADRVTAVTDAIASGLRVRLGLPAATITNGFDPDDGAAQGNSGPSGLLDSGRHSLVYTGRLHTARPALRALIQALRGLVRDAPEEARRLEVVLAGPLTSADRQLIDEPGLRGVLRHLGVLEHSTALRLQREADSLLLLAAEGRPYVATAKLFEYLAAGRPIVILGQMSQAREIATGAGAATVESAGDSNAIQTTLARLVSGSVGAVGREAAPRAEHRHSWPNLASRMAEVIEEARRRSRDG